MKLQYFYSDDETIRMTPVYSGHQLCVRFQLKPGDKRLLRVWAASSPVMRRRKLLDDIMDFDESLLICSSWHRILQREEKPKEGNPQETLASPAAIATKKHWLPPQARFWWAWRFVFPEQTLVYYTPCQGGSNSSTLLFSWFCLTEKVLGNFKQRAVSSNQLFINETVIYSL